MAHVIYYPYRLRPPTEHNTHNGPVYPCLAVRYMSKARIYPSAASIGVPPMLLGSIPLSGPPRPTHTRPLTFCGGGDNNRLRSARMY
jgi:hypothetical protein